MESDKFLQTDFNKTNPDDQIYKQVKAMQYSTNIDFNYPSLNRKDLMSYSVITNKDAPLRKFKQLHTNRKWSVNLYNLDIEGSSPRKFGAFNQKIDYTNKNDDIEKSSPKKLHIGLNKPQYNLSNEDIEYSNPHCVKCKINRHLNPLEPKYNLPKCPAYPPYTPKFIRDNLNVNDIEGAKPKKITSNSLLRDTLKNDDVKDSWPKKPYIRKSKYEFMDYRDVTNTDFKTRRHINPLDPFYKLNYVDGTKYSFGPIEKNKPVVYSKYLIEKEFNLKNDDIEGSNPGSKNKYKKYVFNTSSNDIGDIQGTKTGTLLKGISTKRNTNPIWPHYKYPGEDELKGNFLNNPYKSFNSLAAVNNSKSFVKNKKMNSELDIKENNEKKEEIKDLKKSISEIHSPSRNINNNEEKNKILDKNVKILNNSESLKKTDELPDFGNIPIIEDVVEFDKEKYKKPNPNYSLQHDNSIIPPIEEFKRKKIMINPEIRTYQEINKAKIKFMKKNKASPLLSEPRKTYERKLDDFMTRSNMKFMDPKKQKNVQTFLETGLPDDLNENDTNSNQGINSTKKSSNKKIPEVN